MPAKHKIYTKKGDKGETSLIGGMRVPKYHQQIETYGTIDELSSFVGLIRDQDIDEGIKATLIEIQNRLFTAATQLAVAPDYIPQRQLPAIKEEDIEFLENQIDKMNDSLPPITGFILQGGHQTVSFCNIARAVCRRAERVTISLSKNQPVNDLIIKYLNRLSDYLFVLSRKLTKDLKAVETPWKVI